MEKVLVKHENKSYPAVIDNSFEGLYNYFKELCDSKEVLIVTDSNIADIYLQEIKDIFNSNQIVIHEYIIKAGEESKNINTINEIYTKFIDAGLDRGSTIIGLGGGVVGDIAGFVASTYMRGVQLIHIPTTILAQVDSSIGGKTAIDFEGYKNIIGTFYAPRLVYINIESIIKMPNSQFISGLAEVIKYGLIWDEGFVKYLVDNAYNILSRDINILSQTIKQCILIKSDITQRDLYDNEIRSILNFGHTVGHALECYSDFKMTHGECVAIGMAAAADISQILNISEPNTYEQVVKIIKTFNLPIKLKADNTNSFISCIKRDKKIINDNINFIALEKVGKSKIINMSLDKLINVINTKLL